MGQASGVEGIRLRRRSRFETIGAAIAYRSRFAIDGGGDAKGAGRAAVKVALVVGHSGRNADSAQNGVVKLFGGFEVFDPDHDVTEHCVLLENPVVGE